MARDKLITVRIEGEKRQAFGDLAKSQNTDTASLLYDFISGCLDGRIDISLVTGKKQWIDKIDNQIGSNRLDKLETDTQRIDHWIGALSERVNDWILRSDRRVNDCEKGLSDKIISLEHRLNALASQLDSQQDSQQIDSIDTDSQKDSQQENPDMEPLIKEALRLDHLDDQNLIDAIESQIEESTEIDKSDYESVTSPLPPVATVETMEPDSIVDPDKGAIDPVRGDSPQPKNQLVKAVTIEKTRQGLTNAQLSKKIGIPTSTIEKWKGKIKIGEPIVSKKYPDFFKQWSLNLDDSLWYEVD